MTKKSSQGPSFIATYFHTAVSECVLTLAYCAKHLRSRGYYCAASTVIVFHGGRNRGRESPAASRRQAESRPPPRGAAVLGASSRQLLPSLPFKQGFGIEEEVILVAPPTGCFLPDSHRRLWLLCIRGLALLRHWVPLRGLR